MASNLKCYAFSNSLRIDENLDPVNKIILEANLKRFWKQNKTEVSNFLTRNLYYNPFCYSSIYLWFRN